MITIFSYPRHLIIIHNLGSAHSLLVRIFVVEGFTSSECQCTFIQKKQNSIITAHPSYQLSQFRYIARCACLLAIRLSFGHLRSYVDQIQMG